MINILIESLILSLCLYLACVFVINGARGFQQTFIQFVLITWIMGFFDRIVVDTIWVGHTKAWIISGTEDLMPYIPVKIHIMKWISTLCVYPALGALICWGNVIDIIDNN